MEADPTASTLRDHCHFESICETCTHFATDTTFQPVLLRRRDHAAKNHQDGLHAQSLVDSFEDRDRWLASGMETGVDEGYAKLDALVADLR